MPTSAMPAAAQQYSLTQVPGVVMCNQDNMDACFTANETKLLKHYPDIIRRSATGETSITLLNGSWLPITNEWVDFSNCWHALDMQKGDRYLTLGCVAEEDDWWVLVDRKIGKFYNFSGYPYLSPESTYVAVANQDEMNSNKFEMFSLKSGKAVLLTDVLADNSSWWPDALCWADDTTLVYKHVAIVAPLTAANSSNTTTHIEHLKLQNGRWRITSGRPGNIGSCDELVG